MMSSFHMAKCAQRCVGKYIQGTGLEDVLVEAGVMGVKVVESFLAGTHYVRSFRGIQILSQAIEIVKWKAFWKLQDKSEFEEALEVLKEFANALKKRKDHEVCKAVYEYCKSKISEIRDRFSTFVKTRSENSELCTYWNGIGKLSNMLKNLVAADREGDWKGHLQAAQDLLFIFSESDSINYLRYGSWYLEKIRYLEIEKPEIYKQLDEGKFVVQTNKSKFIGFARHET